MPRKKSAELIAEDTTGPVPTAADLMAELEAELAARMETKHLFTGDLAKRLIWYIDRKRFHPINVLRGRRGKPTFSVRSIAKDMGMKWDNVHDYLMGRRRFSIDIVDKMLFACDIDVLDLLTPTDIIKAYERMCDKDRSRVRMATQAKGPRGRVLKSAVSDDEPEESPTQVAAVSQDHETS